MKTKEKVALILVGLFAFITLYVSLAFNFWPEGLLGSWQLAPVSRYYGTALAHHISPHQTRINFHIALALVMLIIGVFQFHSRFRIQNKFAHKVMGAIYFAAGAVAIGSMIPFSANSLGGIDTQSAVVSIGVIWFVTAGMGIWRIYKGDRPGHRLWMTRNYAMAIATFFIRPVYIVFAYIFPEVSLDQAFPISFWLCLVIALVVNQWFWETAGARR